MSPGWRAPVTRISDPSGRMANRLPERASILVPVPISHTPISLRLARAADYYTKYYRHIELRQSDEERSSNPPLRASKTSRNQFGWSELNIAGAVTV